MDISVFFTSALTSSERRISPQWTLAYLKQRLEPITGIAPENQILQYFPHRSSNESIEIHSTDENATVANFNIVAYSRIHVTDADPDSRLGELADDSNVQQFQLSEEDYAARGDSVLQWKKEQRLGRFAPGFDEQKARAQDENEQLARGISVGQRCRVINIEGERRGVVRFVGKIPLLDSGEFPWVGVEFDEPVGKNDGLIGSERIFTARPQHGSFVKPRQIEVGDFPELDPFASDDEI